VLSFSTVCPRLIEQRRKTARALLPCAQIIHINLTSESPQPLSSGGQLAFTYSVQWKATSIPFVRRFERYLDFNFFEHQVGCVVFRLKAGFTSIQIQMSSRSGCHSKLYSAAWQQWRPWQQHTAFNGVGSSGCSWQQGSGQQQWEGAAAGSCAWPKAQCQTRWAWLGRMLVLL
jgi:hypothetical protein